MKRNLILFVLASAACGIASFLGSIAGNAISASGLFIGALIGGASAVVLMVLLFAKRRYIQTGQVLPTLVWGLFSFGVATLFAVTNLGSPIIPVISLSFVGIGCIVGKSFNFSQGNKKPFFLALAGFLLVIPTIYFVVGSLLRYNLGFTGSFTLLEIFEQSSTPEYIDIISTIVFLGGTLLCIMLNALACFTGKNGKQISVRFKSGVHKSNLTMMVSGCLLMLTLMTYLFLENF
jgi:hypothetical protein